MMPTMNIVTVSLAGMGLWISIYFTGVYYKLFAPDVFWIPKVCQFTKKTCLSVLETPRAKIFGIPNSALGILIYSYLILDGFLPLPLWIGLILLTAAVGRSLFLAYSLIYVTKIPCPLCFTSHALNLALFLIYLLRCLS